MGYAGNTSGRSESNKRSLTKKWFALGVMFVAAAMQALKPNQARGYATVPGVAATGLVINLSGDVATDAISSSSTGQRISGHVVYNDLRTTGLFALRRDLTGNVGSEAGYSETGTNYLGALDVVADFYEIDSQDFNRYGVRCQRELYLGSVSLNAEGGFSKSVGSDDCTLDGNTTPDIAVRFRLRFCGSERCFAIEDDDQDTYVLWHPNARPDNPKEVGTSGVTLTTMAFQTTSGGHDNYAQAANVYASMVEVTRVWHRYNSIPFDPRGDGEVYVRFPSSFKNIASTQSDHQMHIPQPDEWLEGNAPYHEYGHVINMRAWDGTTGDCGECPGGQYAHDGDDTWGPTTREYPNAAWGEGWANFVRYVVENYPDKACDSIDDNADTEPVADPNDGESYARNVTKLLCDWYDDGSHNDDDPNMAGDGDHFTASLYSIWYNLDRMWDWVDDRDGLIICDYIDYYLNGRNSAANVGAATHNNYVLSIADLAYNNGLECDLDEPD